MSLEIEFICAVCGKELEGNIIHSYKTVSYNIENCPECIKDLEERNDNLIRTNNQLVNEIYDLKQDKTEITE